MTPGLRTFLDAFVLPWLAVLSVVALTQPKWRLGYRICVALWIAMLATFIVSRIA